ncbi:molecular chaperone GrpE (heat shock protein) [Paenibacillus turicensis]|uniref:Molecular chaperone GrpE (Heat shock protein) n=1 Tax=Paenibacillus turicensis TaxID=160487 RepID=A0ABS4FSR2_9BACL|nr:Cthe_2314 family HEPN domain-containing protein [Paenibacillus turicensis]MBP1905604.1 molecular chaperone GrpE (heat shock protein) [Paenibacillus turicensis]
MLRELLGQSPRENEGLLADTFLSIKETIHLLQKEMNDSKDPSHDFRKLEIWCRGLLSSLDELEGCLFAATFFRNKVVKSSTEDMNAAEQMDYARYVFFYKDGFIRVFSILDKLGTVLNELFDLHTSKVKTHFSYFTVLRQFAYMKTHPDLGNKLFAIKEQYKEALSELRRRRNTEIHYMNSEMKDDLWQRHQALYGKIKLEDLDAHLHDLQQGFNMVCETMLTTFSYTNQRWKKVKDN